MKYLSFIIIVIVLSSCEKEIKVNFPTSDLLVGFCFFGPDSIWQFSLQKAADPLTQTKDNFINNAIVYIVSSDGEHILLENSQNGLYTNNKKPNQKKSYKVIAVYQNDTLESNFVYIPDSLSIKLLETDTNWDVNDFFYFFSQEDINFQKKANKYLYKIRIYFQKRHYFLIYAKDTVSQRIIQPVISEKTRYLYENQSLNKQDSLDIEFILDFTCSDNYEQTDSLLLILRILSDDYWKFFNSYEPYLNRTEIYSNLTKGYGMFTSYKDIAIKIPIEYPENLCQ